MQEELHACGHHQFSSLQPLGDPEHAALRLQYEVDSEWVDYWIFLGTTVPHFGGRRLWFKCPETGARVRKLYLPPGGRRFASRKAYDLTYKSCRDSGKSDRLCRWLAAKLGKDEASVRESLL